MKELTSQQIKQIVGAAPCPLSGIIATGIVFMALYTACNTMSNQAVTMDGVAFSGFVGVAIAAATTVI